MYFECRKKRMEAYIVPTSCNINISRCAICIEAASVYQTWHGSFGTEWSGCIHIIQHMAWFISILFMYIHT